MGASFDLAFWHLRKVKPQEQHGFPPSKPMRRAAFRTPSITIAFKILMNPNSIDLNQRRETQIRKPAIQFSWIAFYHRRPMFLAWRGGVTHRWRLRIAVHTHGIEKI
jgi:hypothetical protein